MVQIANNTPIWARIYYLLRSGHAREALEFATENEAHLQKLEKSFVPYFKAWLDSEDRRYVVFSDLCFCVLAPAYSVVFSSLLL